ncbi:RNase adapter RapZ [soil metagenome]
MEITDRIKNLFLKFNSSQISNIDKLPQSGGDRVYFRIFTDRQTFIATYNVNLKENETFFYFTDHFKKYDIPVCNIYSISDDRSLYIQEDFGDDSLLKIIEQSGYSLSTYELLKKSLKTLAAMQVTGGKNLNYEKCITSKEFGQQAILSDLLYFKYYFLDTLKLPYDKELLIEEFDQLAEFLSKTDLKYFMFRDFQSRNIMVKNNEIHFIDYQGGMKGAVQYDVASLLWQAKANLPEEWKENLLHYYINCLEELLHSKPNHDLFIRQYNGYVLIRLLQVLGAYGFRGIFERKAHFLTSIPLALQNLKWYLSNKEVGIKLPEFERLLQLVIAEDVKNKFETKKATEQTQLIVTVNSFSYKISGIPADTSENVGGFVFDCRGILNPGRFDEYKQVNGRDKGVITFLEERTKMPEFINSIYNVVDIAVENYIERNFESLMISFGCTGGCHRSVYAADAVARHIRNKFGVKIKLNHFEQKIYEQKGF